MCLSDTPYDHRFLSIRSKLIKEGFKNSRSRKCNFAIKICDYLAPSTLFIFDSRWSPFDIFRSINSFSLASISDFCKYFFTSISERCKSPRVSSRTFYVFWSFKIPHLVIALTLSGAANTAKSANGIWKGAIFVGGSCTLYDSLEQCWTRKNIFSEHDLVVNNLFVCVTIEF